MIEAIRNYQPASNWITAGLLTLLVVSFGVFASEHKRHDVDVYTFTAPELSMIKLVRTDPAKNATNKTATLFRYH